MIPLTTRQMAAIREASEDRLSFASACDFTLGISGKDYTRFADELRIPEQDGPGVVLEGTLATSLPAGLEEERVAVEYLVGGERILSYDGTLDSARIGAYESTFLAGTPSRYASRTAIGDGPGDDLEYVNAYPSVALYEAAYRLGYEGYEIPFTPEPLFTRAGDDAYRWTDYVSDVYQALADPEGTNLVPEDTPLSVLTARPEGAQKGAKTAWTFEEGRDFEFGDLTVESREEGRYARVVAWRELPDGSHEKLAERGVDNAGKKVSKNATFFLEIEAPDGALVATESPWDAVAKKAQELAENAQNLSFPCVYPPFFLTRGDEVIVRGRELTGTGAWVREYVARLVSVSTNVFGRTGELKATGGLVSEVFVPKKLPVGRPASSTRAAYGTDHLGRPYFDASLAWVEDDGDYLVLDAGLAGLAGVEVYEDPNAPGTVVVGQSL